MRHRHPRTIAAGVLLAAGALAAGCSGGAGRHIATATGVPAGATATTVNGDQAFIDYAHCMRDHGVADFPDPVQRPGHSGLSLQFPGDSGSPTFRVGDDACRHLIQSIIDMKTRNARGALTAERLQGLIAYARCMRVHQIPLLDPDPSDGHISLGPVPGVPDHGVSRDDARFHTADAACRSQLPADVPDDGSGPP
jgi:hypothetical protein